MYFAAGVDIPKFYHTGHYGETGATQKGFQTYCAFFPPLVFSLSFLGLGLAAGLADGAVACLLSALAAGFATVAGFTAGVFGIMRLTGGTITSIGAAVAEGAEVTEPAAADVLALASADGL
jgi:hypothetical protein